MTAMRLYPHHVPQQGDILTYRLRAEQHPTDPLKEWHGTILMVLVNVGDRHQERFYMVQVHEIDGTELVYPNQVVSFSPQVSPQ